jgi:predicted permease
MSEKTMAQFKAKALILTDGRRGESDVDKSARTPLTLLLALTGLVLLIACANIANLLLARGANRSTEMAVRLSLGASRGQVLRQLMGESLLLAVLGGAASLLVAKWTLHGIAALLPPDAVGSLHLGLETPMVVFAAGLAIATGFLFGMFPALHSTRSDLITTIRSGAGQLAGHRAAARFRSTLVTAQIALSMALLITAGLFVKSLARVSRVDLGISTEHVMMFGVSPELNGYTRERSRVFFARLEEELRAIPGVQGVTVGLVGLIQGNNWGNNVNVEGFPRGPDVDNNSRWNEVGAGYFKTLGVPLLSGREFTDADALGGPKVAIVNEAFVRKFHLGRNAVGKRIGSEYNGNEQLDMEIVGLVKDAKYSEVKQVVPPVFFQPWRQDSTIGSLTVYVRSSLPPEQLVPSLRATVSRLDSNLPIEQLRTLPEQVKENVFLDRMISTLSAAFAGLATLLAAVGLYGVLAYTVAQRTREIGVRMALGADAGKVRAMVLRQVGRMTLIGGVVGIAGAIGLGKAAKSLLFELSGTDPVIIGLATAMAVLVAFGAGYVPALRASRVRPMEALRYE